MLDGRPGGSNLVEILRHRAATDPCRLAYQFLDGRAAESASVTYGELDREARSVASELQRLSGGDGSLQSGWGQRYSD